MSRHQELIDRSGNYYEEDFEEKTKEESFRMAFDDSLRDPVDDRQKAKLPPWQFAVAVVVMLGLFFWALSGDVHGKATEEGGGPNQTLMDVIIVGGVICKDVELVNEFIRTRGILVQGCRKLLPGTKFRVSLVAVTGYRDAEVQATILKVVRARPKKNVGEEFTFMLSGMSTSFWDAGDNALLVER